MTSDVRAVWRHLAARTSASGDASLSHLSPGRGRAEIASMLATVMGVESDDEALEKRMLSSHAT